RRYHLRYYKTGICIHETDSKGNCTKNGLHCAFAHGPHDLRSPVYDIRWAGCWAGLMAVGWGPGQGPGG
ncbi:UNK isoform 4, partial [Pan troglodytes]